MSAAFHTFEPVMTHASRDTRAVAVSVITPTIGRATLGGAVESVLAQRSCQARIELIVVNDSGAPLADAAWMDDPDVRIIDSGRSERSVARNLGAEAARGHYLVFLDDDDILLPGAVEAWLEAARQTGCPRIYGAYRLVDESGTLVEEIHPCIRGDVVAPILAGESIPLGAMLIERSLFFAAGAFNPRYTALEDYDWVVRSTLLAPIESTGRAVACFRIGASGGSTDWTRLGEQMRDMRETHLNTPEIARRARLSAGEDWMMRGRLARVCLSSAAWNAGARASGRARRGRTAAGRLVAAAQVSGSAVLRRAFWEGLIRPRG